MKKTLSLVLPLFSFLFSIPAYSHTGLASDSVLHTVYHLIINASLAIGLVALLFISFKKLPRLLKQKINK